MSEVELFWSKLQPNFPNWKPWNELHPFQQQQVIQGINLILGTL